jgi:predicted nucleotidyltransferase
LKLTLPGGASARLPRPAGYAALKMRSWIDRSVHGHDKDAKDLALAAFWYQQSAEVDDRLYTTPDGLDILAALDFDVDLAAVRLLGIDVAAQLGPDNRADLARRWAAADMDALARDFVLPSGARLPTPLARRRATVAQIMA